jgi:ABC-2 type transport system permease protein
MQAVLRYFRLWGAFARYGLTRELAFRFNFVLKVTVEALWLGILLLFWQRVFVHTHIVADWKEEQYLFFVGCYFALGAVIETLFLSNCADFADLIRSGDLDFYLLQPIDEQFLITCRNIDWSTVPTVLLGTAVMGFALWQNEAWTFEPLPVLLFPLLFACGVAMAYSFLVVLTASSVWLVRNQSLYEVWWLFTTLWRYPREVFGRPWAAAALGWFFSLVVPIMLVTNVPARTMVKVLDPVWVAYTVGATVALLYGSRRFFRHALRKYRSASS